MTMKETEYFNNNRQSVVMAANWMRLHAKPNLAKHVFIKWTHHYC